MIKIAPSIMCADFCNLGKQIRALERSDADYFHFDVMDGNFVPNFSMGPDILRSIKKITKVPIDVHLMVQEPIRYINEFVQSGADILTVHFESSNQIYRTVSTIKQLNVKASIALNPASPLCLIEQILPELDMVLIMTVEPGFAGQELVPFSQDKVRRLRRMKENKGLKFDIEVDGSINEKTIKDFAKAGADIFVVGTSGIFFKPDPAKAMIELKRMAVENIGKKYK